MENRWMMTWLKEAVSQLPASEATLTYDIAGVPVRISGAHQALVVIPATARRQVGANGERGDERMP